MEAYLHHLQELHDKINGVYALIILAILANFILSAIIFAMVARYSHG